MRVGQLIQAIPQSSGGTTTAFLGTLAALSAAGIPWRAFAQRPAPGDAALDRVAERPEAWTLAERAGVTRPGDLGRAAASAIARGDIDVLHIHGVWCADYLVAAKACRRAGVPYVWQPHGMLLTEAVAQKRWKKELFLAMGGRAALRAASSVLFVTGDEREHSPLPSGVDAERRDVVPLAVEMPGASADSAMRRRARERFGLPLDAPVVSFMGRLHPVKRIDMLIEAVAGVSRGGKPAHALIAGGGDAALEASLRAQAARLGLAERVRFAGWVNGEDKWLALAAGDALSLQSVHENFGFVAVEALCVGTLPVLTSNLSLAAELSAAGLCVVAEPSASGLGEALGAALERDGAGLQACGAGYVAANYSFEAIGGRLGAVYERCLQRVGAAGAGSSRGVQR